MIPPTGVDVGFLVFKRMLGLGAAASAFPLDFPFALPLDFGFASAFAFAVAGAFHPEDYLFGIVALGRAFGPTSCNIECRVRSGS